MKHEEMDNLKWGDVVFATFAMPTKRVFLFSHGLNVELKNGNKSLTVTKSFFF